MDMTYKIRLTHEERSLWEDAARIAGLPLAAWMRRTLGLACQGTGGIPSRGMPPVPAPVQVTIGKPPSPAPQAPLPRERWCPGCFVKGYIRDDCKRCNRQEMA